jgi:flavorubredoxin
MRSQAAEQEKYAMLQATKTRIEPTELAPETFLIHNHQGEGGPAVVALNAMAIRAAEPVIVDTGAPEHRESFLADVFGLVEPEDVRWVYISHDDIDHTGNLNAVMDACPNATLVCNWFITERMGETLAVDPRRWRWVGDGESFAAGDRVLHAVRPPIFDAPTTRGLFDDKTGVYWASDSFATPMLTPVPDVDALDPQYWTDGMVQFHNYISPWLRLVDETRFQRTVDRIEQLAPRAIAGCHTPRVRAEFVAEAMRTMRRTPTAAFPAEPDQAVLDEIQRALSAA